MTLTSLLNILQPVYRHLYKSIVYPVLPALIAKLPPHTVARSEGTDTATVTRYKTSTDKESVTWCVRKNWIFYYDR